MVSVRYSGSVCTLSTVRLMPPIDDGLMGVSASNSASAPTVPAVRVLTPLTG
jgi:hypothetical protein